MAEITYLLTNITSTTLNPPRFALQIGVLRAETITTSFSVSSKTRRAAVDDEDIAKTDVRVQSTADKKTASTASQIYSEIINTINKTY